MTEAEARYWLEELYNLPGFTAEMREALNHFYGMEATERHDNPD